MTDEEIRQSQKDFVTDILRDARNANLLEETHARINEREQLKREIVDEVLRILEEKARLVRAEPVV